MTSLAKEAIPRLCTNASTGICYWKWRRYFSKNETWNKVLLENCCFKLLVWNIRTKNIMCFLWRLILQGDFKFCKLSYDVWHMRYVHKTDISHLTDMRHLDGLHRLMHYRSFFVPDFSQYIEIFTDCSCNSAVIAGKFKLIFKLFSYFLN